MVTLVCILTWQFCISDGPSQPLPIEGPWRHSNIKAFLKNVDDGKEKTGTYKFVGLC